MSFDNSALNNLSGNLSDGNEADEGLTEESEGDFEILGFSTEEVSKIAEDLTEAVTPFLMTLRDRFPDLSPQQLTTFITGLINWEGEPNGHPLDEESEDEVPPPVEGEDMTGDDFGPGEGDVEVIDPVDPGDEMEGESTPLVVPPVSGTTGPEADLGGEMEDSEADNESAEVLPEDVRVKLETVAGQQQNDIATALETGDTEDIYNLRAILQTTLDEQIVQGEATTDQVNAWLEIEFPEAFTVQIEDDGQLVISEPDYDHRDGAAKKPADEPAAAPDAGAAKSPSDKPEDQPADGPAAAPADGAPKAEAEKPAEITPEQQEALDAIAGKVSEMEPFAQATGGAKEAMDPILAELQPELDKLTDEQVNEAFKILNGYLAEKDQEIAKQTDGTWQVVDKVEGGAAKGAETTEEKEKEKTLMEQFSELISLILEKLNELLRGQDKIMTKLEENPETGEEEEKPVTSISEAEEEVSKRKGDKKKKDRVAGAKRKKANKSRDRLRKKEDALEALRNSVTEGEDPDPATKKAIESAESEVTEEAEIVAKEESEATVSEEDVTAAAEWVEEGKEWAIWLAEKTAEATEYVQEQLKKKDVEGEVQPTDDLKVFKVKGMKTEELRAAKKVCEETGAAVVEEVPQSDGRATAIFNIQIGISAFGDVLQAMGTNNTVKKVVKLEEEDMEEPEETPPPVVKPVETPPVLTEEEETPPPPTIEKKVETDTTDSTDGADDPFDDL